MNQSTWGSWIFSYYFQWATNPFDEWCVLYCCRGEGIPTFSPLHCHPYTLTPTQSPLPCALTRNTALRFNYGTKCTCWDATVWKLRTQCVLIIYWHLRSIRDEPIINISQLNTDDFSNTSYWIKLAATWKWFIKKKNIFVAESEPWTFWFF